MGTRGISLETDSTGITTSITQYHTFESTATFSWDQRVSWTSFNKKSCRSFITVICLSAEEGQTTAYMHYLSVLRYDFNYNVTKLLIPFPPRISVSLRWRRRISRPNWRRWSLNGTAMTSPLVTSSLVVSCCFVETPLVRLSPRWKIRWWSWAHWWVTGEYHVLTTFISGW